MMARTTRPGDDGGIGTESARTTPSRPGPGDAGSTWWAPATADWWIGILFAVGSACFAVGSLPGYVAAVGATADGTTYFVGSLFFTSAAGLQLAQAWRATGPHGLDWWAGAVQFAGTLFFNFSTFDVLLSDLTAKQEDHLIWAPDAFGSACFLASAVIGYRASARPRTMAAVNLAGCIFFAISAVAAYVVPDSGSILDLAAANWNTALGALCFFIGALMLARHPGGTTP